MRAGTKVAGALRANMSDRRQGKFGCVRSESLVKSQGSWAAQAVSHDAPGHECHAGNREQPKQSQQAVRNAARRQSGAGALCAEAAADIQYLTAGCCVGSRLNRFLHVVRSRLNLSSGEKRAGCADMVGVPSGAAFLRVYTRSPLSSV